MNIVQFVISILLFTILAFGIGFIINMILRTTWLPVVIALGVIIGTLLYQEIVPNIFDSIILGFGMLGSIMSGWTIQLLRKKGYRMF
ncbi:YuiB family protein [Brevibacillus humidisoli]|uniref:YuiB family protein n=1 Tax=Brevibacillus humidisoli TaxID=2895522 RepID=UPI001E611963|nr:YuiB family protein [Brevibacillus humidisoli]UFJ39652.1 YuiB family protein [Brevibacillus humidisoli]